MTKFISLSYNKYLWCVLQYILQHCVNKGFPIIPKIVEKLENDNHCLLSSACSVYYPDRSQPVAEGHEILEMTLGGAVANLNLHGRIPTYLTFKRGLLYGHTPAITDLKIIGKVTL